MSPITEAVLTVDAFYGREKAVALLCELIAELEKAYRAREQAKEQS